LIALLTSLYRSNIYAKQKLFSSHFEATERAINAQNSIRFSFLLICNALAQFARQPARTWPIFF
jgi:hypothetical protein